MKKHLQYLNFPNTKILKITLSLTVIASVAIALAHATIVIVTLTLEPLSPKVNESMQFSLFLETPLQVPVEDAIIILEAKPKDGETKHVEVLVGKENFPDIEFIFPPTAIQNTNNWRTWVIWIVGMPLIAAIILTILVLKNPKKDTKIVS